MYIIGIDFGTTNSTLAYTTTDQESPITQFAIPQISATNNMITNHSLLPSILYFPLTEELQAKIASLPWNIDQTHCIGLFAKQRAAEVPSHAITSAKSWICHNGIDRREKRFPQTSENALMSPLEACAAILDHLKSTWNYQMSETPFEQQQILITVPASFDPSARQLVQEAAKLAGYPELVLLEEPQAAFYAWLHQHQHSWREILKEGDTILVIDIGGGTTDFSLISVANENGNLVLERQAVGSHLLLGGDNIDLTLAYLAKTQLENQGHSIDDWQLHSLTQRCREAKEILLSENGPAQLDVTIMGRGSKLIGGSLTTRLSRQEVLRIILDGFFPLIHPSEQSPHEKRIGIQQIGLPYAQDPRISCQLAKFLSMTGETDSNSIDRFVIPTAVLFNGGTLKADALRERLTALLNGWCRAIGKPDIKVLPEPDLDHAVSYGAVNYGLARAGKGIRIKSGTSHSYFIGVEESMPAVPGMQIPMKAICIVPFGLEEGSELELPNQEFALALGEPATFRFFSCPTKQLQNGIIPQMGAVVKNWKQELSELPPIETFMAKSEGDGKTVRVRLKAHVTELGVLELWCESADKRRWKLEFAIRTSK